MPAVMFRVVVQLQLTLPARAWLAVAYEATTRRELTLTPGPR